MRSAKKTVSVIMLLAAGVMISVAATKPTVPTSPKSITKNDTGLFKNLQILPKDISKDSLDKIMDGFKAALGVRCNFCHAFNNGKMDFASDEKPEKASAREMMKMTNKINLKYFGGKKEVFNQAVMEVSCNTCHNGKAHPEE